MASSSWHDWSADEVHSTDTNIITNANSESKQRPIRRKISTSKELSYQVFLKEGYLFKQGRSFQRWRRRYFKLKGRKLYYGNEKEAVIFNQLDLNESSVAECGSKHAHAFQVITPFSVLVLAADNRKDMDDWMHALKTVSNKEFYESGAEQYRSATSGEHTWYVCSHTRPTYCNFCRDTLSGVAWNGLSCEVCKMKVHKRCAIKVAQTCKWTSLESIPTDSIVNDDDMTIVMPHQWLEGNLPMSAKCCVCDRTCGSVLRLQDWRCLWCNALVHNACRDSYLRRCPLGSTRLSILPPVSLRYLSVNGNAELTSSRCGGSPLLVLVNSKSGDNQGVRVLRRFKRLLNPAQVYDLMAGGPDFGLGFFQIFDSFRVLVCGGDGTVGWVFSALDRLNLNSKCWLGIMPLGTGNDLARVMGWGHAFDDNTDFGHLLEKYEHAHTEMLDRWGIMIYEGPTNYVVKRQKTSITCYEDSIANHLSKILSSDDHSVVISSAKVLCESVKDILTKVSVAYEKPDSDEEQGEQLSQKCQMLQLKLDNLLKTLKQESLRAEAIEESGIEREESSSDSLPDMSPSTSHLLKDRRFVQRDALMCRANSLKKAVREIIEHAEVAIDEQNRQTQSRPRVFRKRNKLRQKRSKTSPGSLMTFQKYSSSSSLMDGTHSIPSFSPPVSIASEQPDVVRCASPEQMITPDSSITSGLGPTAPESDSVPMIDDSDALTPRSAAALQPPTVLHPPPSMKFQPPTPAVTPNESLSLSSPFIVGSPEHHIGSAKFHLSSDPDLSLGPPSPGFLDVKSYSDSSIYDDQTDCSDINKTPTRKVSSGGTFNTRTKLRRGLIGRGLIAGGLTTGSLIAEVLLLNADVLGVCASPLMDFEDISLEKFEEKKVMNNYFSVGLDAMISLEFHRKREGYADKARSRSKLYMWYGMLGGKELLQRTYKNLEQRVHLECDGNRIRLPSLQGIVILNIPSYQAGINFWGNIRKEDSLFSAQSYDDRVLEVVAIFGVIHCATSRVVRLQNHRIAQCRHVKIIITGDEPVAVQVDGEPWMQPPGYIQIVHKNRAQVLVRNAQFEATLKNWTEKQAKEEQRPPASLLHMFTEDESNCFVNFLELSNKFLISVKKECSRSGLSDSFLGQSVRQASVVLDRLHPLSRKLPEITHLQFHLTEAVSSIRQLINVVETELLADSATEQTSDISPNLDVHSKSRLEDSLRQLLPYLGRVYKILSVSQSLSSLDKPVTSSSSPELYRATTKPRSTTVSGASPVTAVSHSRSSKSRFTRWLRSAASKFKGRTKLHSRSFEVESWSIDSVGEWLTDIGLGEYRLNFAQHEITGRELLKLERRDLKDLGVTKVGHIKRLQSAINELTRTPTHGSRARSKSAPFAEQGTEESVSSV